MKKNEIEKKNEIMTHLTAQSCSLFEISIVIILRKQYIN